MGVLDHHPTQFPEDILLVTRIDGVLVGNIQLLKVKVPVSSIFGIDLLTGR